MAVCAHSDYLDAVDGIREELPNVRDFVALEGAASRDELIARACGEHEKIRFMPFAFDTEARLRPIDVNAQHARLLHFTAGGLGALEKQAIQHFSGINHDGMRHFESCVMLLAADELDGVNQFLGTGIVEQEGEALDGFVG